jgi:copper chaperone CopZ
MNRLLLVLAVGMCLFGTGCRRQDIRTIMIDVPAMENEAHANMVISAMRSIPGVDTNSVRVDFSMRTVTVRYESLQASLKNIEMAISEAGFAANGVPANPEAAAKVAASSTNKPASPAGPRP